MKKLLLSACICLTGLSAQAMEDWQAKTNWRTGELTPLKKYYAQEYFAQWERFDKEGLSCFLCAVDIRDAMKQFPDFLAWKFGERNRTIVHILASRCKRPTDLFYLLGFSPDLTVKDDDGKTPEDCGIGLWQAEMVFDTYQKGLWRHPENVFELSVNHDEYIYDGKPFVTKEDSNNWYNLFF